MAFTAKQIAFEIAFRWNFSDSKGHITHFRFIDVFRVFVDYYLSESSPVKGL